MRKTEDSNNVEEKILKAAEEEFLAKGYAGARTTSIASAAGVTHAMLHYYFRTKERLFEKIMEDKLESIKEILVIMLDDNGQPFEYRLRSMIERHFDLLTKNPKLPHFMINEVYTNPDGFELISKGIMTIASEAIIKLQKQLDMEAEKGNCRQMDALNLLLDVISLNLFPYIAYPMMEKVLSATGKTPDEFLKQRKEENVRTILAKISSGV